MLISTIAVSGLYVGIAIMPTLPGEEIAQGLNALLPVVPIQASRAEQQVSGDADRADFMPFPAEAQFETGDTWISGGRRYRLYGLQACLRGTSVTVSGGLVRDCGELNLIMAQALIRDTKPICTTLQDIDQHNAIVACQTTTGQHRYDLATYMIAQGWGFSAVDATGRLIVPGYRVAEESAHSARAGLWANADIPHPVAVLMKQAEAPR